MRHTVMLLFNHRSKHEMVINNKVYVKHVALGPRGSPVKGHVRPGFTKCENCREVSLFFLVRDLDVTGQLKNVSRY